MSGRDTEPVAAFFPSIDRNLMLDLDRHFRQAAHPGEVEHQIEHDMAEGRRSLEAHASRPSTSDVLEAVEQAAASMAAMDQRIRELEAKQYELESTNAQLRTKLGELLQVQQASDAKARAEGDRANRAEAIAAQHLSRSQDLEKDLEGALGDLHRIAEAITGSLGGLPRR